MAGATTSSSCGVRPEVGNGADDDVLETVVRIGGRLASEEGGDDDAAAVLESSLCELQRVRMTFEALEATKIGRAVNALRKTAPSEQARRLAAALYTAWKALADERFRSSRSTPPPPPPKADEGIKKSSSSSPPPAAANARKPARPGGELEMAPTSVVVVEAAPEKKLKFHEVLDRVGIVRKPTSLRVANTTNEPAKAEQQQPQHRVTVVRRTAAAIKKALPASNARTRRNGGGGAKSNNQQAMCPAPASHEGTNAAAAKRVSATGAAPSTAAKPPTALPQPRPVGSSGACKRKAEDPAGFDEARLARARARLQERYKEVDAAKEKRKIKEVVKGSDALGKTARLRPGGLVGVRYAVPKLRCLVRRPAGCPGRFEPVCSSK